MNLAALIARLGFNSPSPLLKQAPMVVLFGLAVLLSLLVPALEVSSVAALLGSSLAIIVATAFAALITARPWLARFATIVPAIDFLAVGVLRFGTGESRSIFASLVILPVVWFAAMEARRYIGWAAVGASVTVLLPFLLGANLMTNSTELFRGAFSPLVFAVAAAVINELSRQARAQIRLARNLERAAAAELERAADVQRALLPKDASPLAGYEVAGACIPSKSVGGDFYDWYTVEGGIAFTIGDVMGKGVGAGMIAATARAVVRSASDDENPAVALERTAMCLSTELGEAASFATLFHARLNAADGRVSYADAGHGLTVVLRGDGGSERLYSLDYPLGTPLDAAWARHETTLEPGEMIVSFSDGVLDLYDGTLAAVDEVVKLAGPASTAQEVVDAIVRLARRDQNPDDVTVIAVRRDSAAASAL